MNTLDIVLLLLLIPGIVRGLSRGFLEQAVSLAGVILSVYLAFRFSGAVCERLKEYITVSETLLNVIGFALVLVAVLIVVMIIAKLITRVAEMASLGWLNRVLGLVFSLTIAALILSILLILFDTVNVKFELVKSPILQESLLYGVLKDIGYFVFPYLKQLLMIPS
ncbi:MAG: CvpA family protein [Bacteroidales bacterium]|nr:CvpA family protein [Bacteroidales bacterium]